jgi:hypothetical protein
VLLLFGYDVDTLEVHLHEAYDVADHFFLLEATTTHHNGNRKTLIWQR